MDLQLKLEDGLFHYRGGCSDLIIFRSVHDNNEYKVTPEDIKDKTVIDIGAHIGSFTRLALRMGAKKVIAVEASPMNYEYLIRNTKEYKNCITINAAVGIF